MGTAPTCAGGWAGRGAGGSARTAWGRRGPAWQKAPPLFQPGTVLEPEGGLGEWPGGQTESCLLVQLHLAGSCLLREGRWLRSGMRSRSQSQTQAREAKQGSVPLLLFVLFISVTAKCQAFLLLGPHPSPGLWGNPCEARSRSPAPSLSRQAVPAICGVSQLTVSGHLPRAKTSLGS